jgi:Gpi18-like mannosyltransferase
MSDNTIKARIEILLLFALYMVILPRVYMEYDMGFWRDWALSIHRTGLANTYNSTINYFPVYIYALYVYDLLQGTEANIIRHINNIKILFIFFDFLPVFVLCCFRQRLISFKIPHLFLLLNIAYVFNSLVWGQMDSIYISLSFLAIITGIFYPVTSVLLYLLALNTKQQAIEFLPVMAIVLLYSIRNLKTVFAAVFSAVALQLLILLPFINSGGVGKLIQITANTVGLYNNLSISAFNIWYLITKGNPYFIDHNDIYFVFSYKTIGLILFSVSGLAVLLPLLKRVWHLRKSKLPFDEQTYSVLFLATGLLCLYFFYFNSQMHERYAQPIIIFFFFYGGASRNYKLYILASIPLYLSLDKAFSFPDGFLPIVHYKIIYASKIIALWYTATVIYGSYLYYRLIRYPERSATEM